MNMRQSFDGFKKVVTLVELGEGLLRLRKLVVKELMGPNEILERIIVTHAER